MAAVNNSSYDVKLYDITAMDYYSKAQTPFSTSDLFRDELWRRRNNHHKSHSPGGDIENQSSSSFNVEHILTRNMSQANLRKLLENQFAEAVKLANSDYFNASNGSITSSVIKSCKNGDPGQNHNQENTTQHDENGKVKNSKNSNSGRTREKKYLKSRSEDNITVMPAKSEAIARRTRSWSNCSSPDQSKPIYVFTRKRRSTKLKKDNPTSVQQRNRRMSSPGNGTNSVIL